MTYTRNEIEYLARQRFGSRAQLFKVVTFIDGERIPWWGVAVCGEIIGCRRELSELPALIERGRVADLLGG